MAADFAGAFGADFEGGEFVGPRIDDDCEFVPEAVEGVSFQTAFEDGVLDAHAPVLADFGDAVQALGAGDIVGYEGKHLVGTAAVAGEVARGGVEGGEPVGGKG